MDFNVEELCKLSEKLTLFARSAGVENKIKDCVGSDGFLQVAAFRAAMDLHYLAVLLELHEHGPAEGRGSQDAEQ
jgi:hypothetical protein